MAKKKKEEEPTTEAPKKAQKEKKAGGFSGPHLRKLREQKQITIAQMSESTKISKAVITALEEERYDDMPNARVYVRGFVRCVARELEIDQDDVTRGYLPKWERWFEDQNLLPAQGRLQSD